MRFAEAHFTAGPLSAGARGPHRNPAVGRPTVSALSPVSDGVGLLDCWLAWGTRDAAPAG